MKIGEYFDAVFIPLQCGSTSLLVIVKGPSSEDKSDLRKLIKFDTILVRFEIFIAMFEVTFV